MSRVAEMIAKERNLAELMSSHAAVIEQLRNQRNELSMEINRIRNAAIVELEKKFNIGWPVASFCYENKDALIELLNKLE